ncbi:hypothetical protein [Dysgonomonas sp. ZJ709]|uniref:hypothetical protein n=1 Tax=Dysgonomonas sp. ZJ709 TaxID=2709797 RepID=UPI0013EC4623|nr:hypothetical protein [Dysgonomonas sp. ZJ709]
MGENAIRIEDNKIVKIGKCEEMYYLRYEDRHKVRKSNDSIDTQTIKNVLWRLPLADEDELQVGEYEYHNPYVCVDTNSLEYIHSDCLLTSDISRLFDNKSYQTGFYQLVGVKLGLLVNLTCYHGLKENASNEEANFVWSGRRNPFCLCAISNDTDEMKICFTCIACGCKWLMPFEEIQEYIDSQEMKKRLFKICLEYWEEKHPGQEYPYAMTKQLKNSVVTLKRWVNLVGDQYSVSIDTADGDGQTDYFRELESAFRLFAGYN